MRNLEYVKFQKCIFWQPGVSARSYSSITNTNYSRTGGFEINSSSNLVN